MTVQTSPEGATAGADALGAVVACAAYGVPSAGTALPDAPLAPRAWQSFTTAATRQRLIGLAARAVADGALPVTGRQREEIEQLETAAALLALRLDAVLLETADRLQGVSDFRVLKGAAVANLDYPEPSLRCYGDVDLLVPGETFDAALAVMTAMGGVPRFAEPRAGFTRRFGKGVAVARSDGLDVDVHRTLASGPLGLKVRVAELFEAPETFTLAGTALPALGRELRCLHACFHAALGSARPRLVPLRDVVQAVTAPDLDVRRMLDLAAGWKARVVVARAVGLAWATFEVATTTELSRWAAGYRPSRGEQQALRLYATSQERYARQALGAVAAIDGIGAKAAYLRAMVLPSRTYLAERDAAYLRRWRRALRVARGARAAR